MAVYPPGPSRYVDLPNYGANSAPTDRMLIASAAVGFALGSPADRYIEPNDLLAEITRNVTDLTIQFGNGITGTVSSASKGKIRYNATAQSFQVSENGGAYQNLLKGSGTATRAAFWSAADELSSNANFYWDNVNERLGIGVGSGPQLPIDVAADGSALAQQWRENGAGTARVQMQVPSSFAQLGTTTNHDFALITNGVQHLNVEATGAVVVGNVIVATATLMSNAIGTSDIALIANNAAATTVDIARFQVNASNRFRFLNTGEAIFGLAAANTGKLTMANSAGATLTSLSAGNAASTLNFIWPVVDPTVGQVLSASAPTGGNVTLSWATASGGTPGTPVDSVQFNSPLGTFAGNAGFLYIPGSTTGNGIAITDSTITTGNLVSIVNTGTAAASNTKTALFVSSTGANGTASQTVFGGNFSVTNTGTTNTNIALQLTASGAATASIALNVTAGAIVQTSNLAAAFESGPNGSTNPVFRIVNSTASQADGLTVTGLAAGSGVRLNAISSGSNAPITLTPKGNGAVVVPGGAFSSGGILFTVGNVRIISPTSDRLVIESNTSFVAAFTGTAAYGLLFGSQYGLGWGTSTDPSTNAADVNLLRLSAGVIRVGNGSTGLGSILIGASTDSLTGNFTVMGSNAATNSVVDIARLGVNSTGTAATGFGGILSFSAESSTTNDQQVAADNWFWNDATHATRTGALSWSITNNASLTEYLRLTTAGGGGTFVATAACLAVHNGTAPAIWTAGSYAAKLYLLGAAAVPATGVAANFSTTTLAGPVWMMLRGRGTNASPAAVQTADVLGEIQWNGQFNTSTNNQTTGAAIRAVATETWASGLNGTDLFFYTAITGGTIAEKMSLRNTGTLRINATSGSFNTTTLVQVGNYASWNTDVVVAIYAGANGTKGLEVIGTASATADLFRAFRDSVTPDLFKITAALGSVVRVGQGTNAADYAYLGGNLKTNTTAVSNTGTGQTDLITYSLRANSLGTNGDYVEIDAWGEFAANGNNKQVTLEFGGTTLFDTSALIFNGTAWRIRAKIVRTGATTQIAIAGFDGDIATIAVNSAYSTPGETLSNAITIKCTGTGGASSDITQHGLTVKWHPNGQ